MIRRLIKWLHTCALVLCLFGNVQASEEDAVEDQAARFLMNKHDMLEALQGLQAQYTRYGSRMGVTPKDRQCFYGLAQQVNQQIYNLRVVTEDFTYREFIEYLEEDPEDGSVWAQEIVDTKNSIMEVVRATGAKARSDCMSFEY